MDRKNLVLIGILGLFAVLLNRPAPAASGKLIPPPVLSSYPNAPWSPCGPGFGRRGC